MNASQLSNHPVEPIAKPRFAPRPKRHLRQRSYRLMALETTTKIVVNFVISATAISTLAQLLPYQSKQQDRLAEITTEIKVVQERVDVLQAEFGRNFDPHQVNELRQRQGYRFGPNQIPIVLISGDGGERKSEVSP